MDFQEWYTTTYKISAKVHNRNISFEPETFELLLKYAYEDVMTKIDFHLHWSKFNYKNYEASQHLYTIDKSEDTYFEQYDYMGIKLIVDERGNPLPLHELDNNCLSYDTKCGKCIYALIKSVPPMELCDIRVLRVAQDAILRQMSMSANEATLSDSGDPRYELSVARYDSAITKLRNKIPTHSWADGITTKRIGKHEFLY